MHRSLVGFAALSVCWLALLPPNVARAQAVLTLGTVKGAIQFTNGNPEVLGLMDQCGLTGAAITATSSEPTGYSASSGAPVSGPTSASYELLVEADAQGRGSVTHTMQAIGWVYARHQVGRCGNGNGQYWFQPSTGVVVRPGETVTRNINECVGVLRVRFGTDETCATPVEIRSGVIWPSGNSFNYLSNMGPSAIHYMFRPGGVDAPDATTTLSYSIGTDPALDTIAFRTQIPLAASCDEIRDICIPVPSGGSELGALTGPFDILGEHERGYSSITASGGPNGNGRYKYLYEPMPYAPVEPASGWWTLPNLVPGDYQLTAYAAVRSGRGFNRVAPPPVAAPGTYGNATTGAVTVSPGVTSDARREMNGTTRLPYVMTPGFFHGHVRLADPFVAANPGASSTLSAIHFEPDYDSNGDGVPDNAFRDDFPTTEVVSYWEAYYVGVSRAGFPGAFDAQTGELNGDYELVVPNPYDAPHTWAAGYMNVMFWTSGDVPNRHYYLPPTHSTDFRYALLSISPNPMPTASVGPNTRVRVDRAYCFGEFELLFRAEGANAAIFNPYASFSGAFDGVDWRGQATKYYASGGGSGVPFVGPYRDPDEMRANARTSGRLVLAVPEGTYTINPSASTVSATGTLGHTNAPSLTNVTVGCGQRLSLVPGAAVSLNALGGCATGDTVAVSGRVQAFAVDRIWLEVGGTTQTLCASACGENPTFSASVALQRCTNNVRVFAQTAAGVVSAAASVVWDDPSDGFICGSGACNGGTEVPTVTAACANRTVLLSQSSSLTCGPVAASIDAGTYPAGTTTAQTPTDFGLGDTPTTLAVMDARGRTTTCTAIVSVVDDVNPTLTCPDRFVRRCATDLPSIEGARDNCSESVPTSCETLGSTATCKATDAAGNTAECTAPIVDEPPAPVLDCPSSLTTSCSEAGGAHVSIGATAKDACTGASLVVSCSPGPDELIPVGTTKVSCVVSSGSASASCSVAVTVTAGDACTRCGPLRTQTQGGWGQSPNGANPGAVLQANEALVFPLVVAGGALRFTSAAAVRAFLPQGGPAAALTKSYVDPARALKNVLAGQLTALSISLKLSSASDRVRTLGTPPFGKGLEGASFTLAGSPLSGRTVGEVAGVAAAVLGGKSGSGISASQANEALSAINESYVDGVRRSEAIRCP